MLEGIVDWAFLNIRKAVGIVLVSFLVAIVISQYYETGETYARIGELFRGKSAVAVALIVIALGSAFVSSILLPHLTQAFQDVRVLSSALGFICFAGLYLANGEVDEWNINDRSRFMIGLVVIGSVLTVGPWVYEPILRWITAQIPFL